MSENAPIKEDQIQEQILLAAKQLFAIHGLAKVTMDDVAKAIGKGRSSLYYYYKSKDEIFDAVVHIEINEMLEAVEKAVNEAISAAEKIKAFFVAKLKVMRGKSSFFSSLETGMDANEISAFTQSKLVYHELIMKRESILLTKALQDGMQNGELKTMDKAQVKNLVFILQSMVRGLKRELQLENHTRKPEPVTEEFISMMMHGLHP